MSLGAKGLKSSNLFFIENKVHIVHIQYNRDVTVSLNAV
jgi:hypothetical protein